MKRRGNGILIHITSLPSPFGIGDLGPRAYEFVDFLARTKQSFWQILPLNPIEQAHQYSPYQSSSAFACNPLLISPELMVEQGLVSKKEIESIPEFPGERVDYENAACWKENLFDLAYERFQNKNDNYEYEQFSLQNAYWLDDLALFLALKSHFKGTEWSEWPQELRDRDAEALISASKDLSEPIGRTRFLQYLFFKQWTSLKRYCNNNGIQVIGDMPIYVQFDSADLWVNSRHFKLDHNKKPYVVAGVPPDYFSETGQLWGNPIYRWDVLKESGYDLWIRRMSRNLDLFDFLRIDHFRGMVAYWEVPANEKKAVNGKWVKAPAEDFFAKILKRFPHAPFIAEDLGFITPDVKEIMHHFQFPGMKLLLFAFGDDLSANPYIPHNLVKNCVIYTGTHDNNTARGWFEKEAGPEVKERLFDYLGREITAEEVAWELVRLAMMSIANTAILPVQDILGLGEEARMNRPSTTKGNWQWRLLPDQLTSPVEKRLLKMTEIYGRA
ncbi:MAG: 4-alpha-glucanotransferase [Deltaproteobacteria bacterium]|nr:4-alpha-glucanotransferase [Deltaproteobacteria bacterium]